MLAGNESIQRYIRRFGPTAFVTILLLLLPISITVFHSPQCETDGFVLDRFTSNDKEMSTTFTGSGENTTGFALQFPPGTTLTAAWLNVTGLNDGLGNFPYNLKIDVGNDGDIDWAFNTTGFGPLGRQSVFDGGSSVHSYYFTGSGQDTVNVVLPKNAVISSASVEVKGGASQNYEPYVATCDYNGALYYTPDNGDGTFGVRQYFTDVTTSSGHTGMAVADYDNDGDYDMIVGRAWANIGLRDLYYYQKTGTGVSFSGFVDKGNMLSSNRHPMQIVAGDFTGDGNVDFITSGHQQAQGKVWVGDGAGGFASNTVNFDMYYSHCKTVGDFDEDGDLDIAMGGRPQSGTTNEIYWFENTGTGLSFITHHIQRTTSYGMVAGDFDSDGHLDLLTCVADARWHFHKGDGNGNFASPVYTGLDAGNSHSGYGCARDFDLDGDIDLLAMSDYSQAVLKYYPNNGDATFGVGVSLGDMGINCMAMGIPYGYEPIGASDPKLDIGNDGTFEWTTSGVHSGSTQVSNLANAFTNYLSTATTFQDPYGNDMVSVPITLSSTDEGFLGLRELAITYTSGAMVDTNPHSGNLANEINAYLGAQPVPPQGSNITVPIRIISSSAGGVLLSDLHFEYNAYPISYFIPDQIIPEGLDDPTFLDLSVWFKDDYDLPDILDYSVVFNSQDGVLDASINGHFLHVNLTTNPHWNSPTNGTFTLQLKAMDSSYLNSTSNMFDILVESVNDEPYPSILIPDVIMAEDSEDTSINLYDIQYFIDPEPFDDIYYEIEIDPLDVYEDEQIEAQVDSKNKDVVITASEDFNTGDEGDPIPVWIYADDSQQVKTLEDGPNNFSYQEILVWVEPVNDPPVWGSIPPLTLMEDSPKEYIFDLNSVIIDVDNTKEDFQFTLIENNRYTSLELVIESDGNISVPSLKENWFGTAGIELEVSDGLDDARAAFSIDVISINDHPSVTITEPAEGVEVSGEVVLKGRLEDVDNSFTDLELQLQIGVDPWVPIEVGPFWTYTWNTTGEENGHVTLMVRAFDGLNYSESISLNLTINNQLAHPPQVSFISPADGWTVSDTVSLTGLSTDPDGDDVTVQVRIGDTGQWQNAIGSAPWSFQWNTSTSGNGLVPVTIRAFDGALYSQEMTRTFNVDNVIVNDTKEKNGTDTGDGGLQTTTLLILLVIIVVIVVVVLVFIFVFKKDKQAPPEPEPMPPPLPGMPTSLPVLTVSAGPPPSAGAVYPQQPLYQPPPPAPPPMQAPQGPYQTPPPTYMAPADPYGVTADPYYFPAHPYQSAQTVPPQPTETYQTAYGVSPPPIDPYQTSQSTPPPPTDPYQTPQSTPPPPTDPYQTSSTQYQQPGAASTPSQLPSTEASGEWPALPAGKSEEEVIQERVDSQLELMATYNYLIELSKENGN